MIRFLATCLALALPLAALEKPNIVFIMLDDAGWGDFSCYGQKKFQTPNIDKLAAEGMKFTDHYSGSTVCTPTRCVLMTGLHTGQAALRGNKKQADGSEIPLPDEALTFAEILKKEGYATGAFGKWGMGAPGSEGWATRQGFDRYYGYRSQRAAHDYYPRFLIDDEKKVMLDGQTYSHTLVMEKGLEWLGKQKEGPFFLYLPLTIPHAAMQVPEEFAQPFREKFSQFEDVIGSYGRMKVKNPAAMFAGMMTLVDRDIGRIMEQLKKMGIDENTLVIFTSDNGPHKEGGHMPDFFNSNGPFRGFKRDLTEGGIRAPLIARWPGKIAPGSTSNLVSAHWDVLPTVCELIGAKIPETTGFSLLPTLTGKGAQEEHDYLYWEFIEKNKARAIRTGDWKIIQQGLEKKGKDAPLELYNLVDDPGETKNLATEFPDITARALEFMNEAHVPSEDFPLPWEK